MKHELMSLDKIMADLKKRTKADIERIEKDSERRRKAWMRTERFGDDYV